MTTSIKLPKSVSELKGMLSIAFDHYKDCSVMDDDALNESLAKALGFDDYNHLKSLVEAQTSKPELSLEPKQGGKSSTGINKLKTQFMPFSDSKDITPYSASVSNVSDTWIRALKKR